MSPLDLIPAPYSIIAKVGLPILALGGVWLAGDLHGHHAQSRSDAATIAALNGTIANMKAASAAAKSGNVGHVATVEGKQAQVTKDHENDYPQQLSDARSTLAAYKRLHPATAQGDAGRDPVPQVPDAPGKPDADPAQAVVSASDLDRCAQDYVIAVALQSWIRDQGVIQR